MSISSSLSALADDVTAARAKIISEGSGVLYKCTRDTGNPVYHALSALVRTYVEVVENDS